MKYELKRIHIWSAAKITFLITLILGLLMSLFYIVSLTLVQNLVEYIGEGIIDESMIQLVSANSLFLVFFISVFYAVVTTVFTIFFTALYNIIAGKTGGISFTLTQHIQEQSEQSISIEHSQES
ncbi:DUF3566 domain-containing protein [candidate division KSB1 bacterium]